VGTSAARIVIVVAAIVLGAVGLAKAVPSDASRHIVPGASGGSTSTSSPSPSPAKSLPPSKSLTKGVTVRILNGSGTIGLAGDTRTTIKSRHLGYKLLTPGDAARTSTTVIYYKPGLAAAAHHLGQLFFPQATYQPSTAQFKAKLTVVLGADFAATTTSPSP
jgi:hypothetical protein